MTTAWTRASTTSSSAPTRVKHRYAIRSERVQLRDSSPRSLPSSAAVDILTSSTSDEGEEVAWGEMNEISEMFETCVVSCLVEMADSFRPATEQARQGKRFAPSSRHVSLIPLIKKVGRRCHVKVGGA